eukprot:815729-Prymnesium_polylepis.1
MLPLLGVRCGLHAPDHAASSTGANEQQRGRCFLFTVAVTATVTGALLGRCTGRAGRADENGRRNA